MNNNITKMKFFFLSLNYRVISLDIMFIHKKTHLMLVYMYACFRLLDTFKLYILCIRFVYIAMTYLI